MWIDINLSYSVWCVYLKLRYNQTLKDKPDIIYIEIIIYNICRT